MRRYPFKNLVFKGGGVKGFAYIGALEVLEEYKILPQIERVGGTSAGSIISTIISFNESIQDTIDTFKTLDYSKIIPVMPSSTSKETKKFRSIRIDQNKLRDGISSLERLFRNYGLFSTEPILEWLQETIAQRCNGNGNATFADFAKLGFRDLHIVATNLSTNEILIFNNENTPDVPVAHAAVASSTIPFLFEPKRFDGKTFGSGDYIVDGGMLTNFPIQIFDAPKFKQKNRYYLNNTNWETLGCRLYTPKHCEEKKSNEITGLRDYIQNFITTLSMAEDKNFEHRIVDRLRTISISNCCVEGTDLDVRPDSRKYKQLLEAGRSSTKRFLEGYKLPVKPALFRFN